MQVHAALRACASLHCCRPTMHVPVHLQLPCLQLQMPAPSLACRRPAHHHCPMCTTAVWRQRAGIRPPSVAAAAGGRRTQAAAGWQDAGAHPHERYRRRPPCERGSAQGRWVLVWVLAGVVLSLRGMWGLCWVAWRPSALVCCSWGASAAAWSLCVMAAGVAAC